MCADTPEYMSRPGTILHLRTLPDNTPVVLDGMRVAQSGIPIIRIKDPWSGRDSIAVDVGLRAIEESTSIEITGSAATVNGEKTVIVSRVRQYLTMTGRPFLMMPKPAAGPSDWPYMREIPIDGSLQGAQSPSQNPYRLTAQPTNRDPGGGMQLLSEPISTLGMAAMTNRSAAAGAQHGGDGLVPGVTTTDRLVKCWGKITAHDTSGNAFFYINDGSAIDDGSGYSGLRINWPFTGITPPAPDSLVAVKGTSGTAPVNGRNVRAIAPGSPCDVRVFSPVDTTCPAVSITAPSGNELQLAPAATGVVISGKAFDGGTGVASVEVKIGSGSFETVTYNSGTRTWSCVWSSPASTTIYVRATDFAGNTCAAISRAVTVATVNVIYVDCAREDDSGSGLSWGTAKKTVAAALDTANGQTDIWVAAGTYTGGISMRANVGLYGGFAVGETCRQERNWHANPTILDGGDMSRVVEMDDVSNCTLDGFTIQHGNCYDNGGGIFCAGTTGAASNIIIRNNIVRDNSALYSSGLFASNVNPLIVAGNVFVDNSGDNALHCWSGVGGHIANNTIICNDATGICLAASSPAVTNNIISANGCYGLYITLGSQPSCNKNVVHKNGWSDYRGFASAPPTDLILGTGADIGIDTASHDWHITGDSPCVDAGATTTVLADGDIDCGSRIYGTAIDIGADENTGCLRYTITPALRCVPIDTDATLTIAVTDMAFGQPAVGTQVHISIDAGEITSVTSNGGPPVDLTNGGTETGPRSIDAVTGPDGTAQFTVKRADQGHIHITGTVTACGAQLEVKTRVWFYDPAQPVVRFLCDLCCPFWMEETPNQYIHGYLQCVASAYPAVDYETIADAPRIVIEDSVNTLFLALPIRNLGTAELVALSDFVASGHHKRLVLIGEHGYAVDHHSRLNEIAAFLGLATRFGSYTEQGEGPWMYDESLDRDQHCPVAEHYLTQGIWSAADPGLWDSVCYTFQPGWESPQTHPLAYIRQQPTLPWIIEEETNGAGRVVLVHDSSLFLPDYNDQWDDVPERNFKFAHNLCTRFP